jgi:hypothetical protein
MKNKPYRTAGTVPDSKRKMVKRVKIDTPTINSWVNNLILKRCIAMETEVNTEPCTPLK